MKFGNRFYRYRLPAWSSAYVDYDGLKRLNRIATAGGQEKQQDISWADLFSAIDQNLIKVDSFYQEHHGTISKGLAVLREKYGGSIVPQDLERDILYYFYWALFELRREVWHLQWFLEVNRRAFERIFAKIAKSKPNIGRDGLRNVDTLLLGHMEQNASDSNAIRKWITLLLDTDSYQQSANETKGKRLRYLHKSSDAMSSELFDMMDQAIQKDDASMIAEVLKKATGERAAAEASYQNFLQLVLKGSIAWSSRACVEKLLPQIDFPQAHGSYHGRNIIHELIVENGRSKPYTDEEMEVEKPMHSFTELERLITTAYNGVDQEQPIHEGLSDTMAFALDKFQPSQRLILTQADEFGRLPLHYAALYGLTEVIKTLLMHMQQWGQFYDKGGFQWSRMLDLEGKSPLHLSVIGRHVSATKTLLSFQAVGASNEESLKRHSPSLVSCLLLAVQYNSVDVVKLFKEAGIDFSGSDDHGETALHSAARLGHLECAKELVEGLLGHKSTLNASENTFGWTPLIIASREGNLPMVELLLQAGAPFNTEDFSNQTAKDYAALKGYMKIARKLSDLETGTALQKRPTFSGRRGITPVRRHECGLSSARDLLTDKSKIILTLGSANSSTIVEPVELYPSAHYGVPNTNLHPGLSLKVSATNAQKTTVYIDLPALEDARAKPISFMAEEASKVKLTFDIFEKNASADQVAIGRAVALLGSIKSSIGPKQSSLQSSFSVPILSSKTLEAVGHVNFNYLVITPFSHQNLSSSKAEDYWKDLASPVLVGHRGLGKNVAPGKQLQIGENTIQSFMTAADLGASFVEFDVQLTKDLVPIIYHDFLVSETGVDIPLHDVTLKQFMHISKAQQPSQPIESNGNLTKVESNDNSSSQNGRLRSYSYGSADNTRAFDMIERMRNTVAFNFRGFKGNIRGDYVQESMTTLDEMFKTLPESLGFNIEIKYPMVLECELWGMNKYAIELNTFIDTILKKVFDLGVHRNIYFSSFNPEVCVFLAHKQLTVPILFLTDGGASFAGDVRADSVQDAIRFAKTWGLHGIVSTAEPFVLCPALIQAVKDAGLLCASYGTLNNEPENAKLQADAGIDALIVDSVHAISKTLKAYYADEDA